MDKLTQNELLELYISNVEVICEGFTSAINSARAGFLETFNLMLLPTKRDERYRHCDVKQLFEGEWEHYFTPVRCDAERAPMPLDGYRIELHNGFCAPDSQLITLDNGVVIGSLRDAGRENQDVVERYYNSLADNDGESLTALNSVFMQDAAFVYVPDGVKLEVPIIISYDYSTHEQSQMCFSRTLIIAGKDAKLDIVIEHRTLDGAKFLVDYVRETVVGEGARVSVTELCDMNSQSTLIKGIYTSQQKQSNAQMLNLWLNGGVTRVNMSTSLKGEDCDSTLHGLYMAGGEQLTDLSVCIDHLVANCRSFEQVKGVVGASAIGAFRGRVYVAPDAQRTQALQQSRNLQLSDTSRIYTEPQLEIYADDVKCSHGATVGQLDNESIYYMRQRGISEQDARKLQMYGFVNDVVLHCKNQELCAYLRETLQTRIDSL